MSVDGGEAGRVLAVLRIAGDGLLQSVRGCGERAQTGGHDGCEHPLQRGGAFLPEVAGPRSVPSPDDGPILLLQPGHASSSVT